VSATGLFLVAWWISTGLKIGELHAGVPQLRPESRDNQD
jgi:hypothetical protein